MRNFLIAFCVLLSSCAFADIPNTGYDAGSKAGSGSGSGTVSSGTINHFAGYNAAGTIVAPVANMTYDSSGNLFVHSVTTDTSNTPETNYYPTLAGDTHWKWCMSSDGDGTSNDHLYLVEGTDCSTARRLDLAPGGVMNFSSVPTFNNVAAVTISSSSVFTNKTMYDSTNVTTQMTSATDASAPAPTGGSLANRYDLTALAQAATFAAPSGSPIHGNKLFITIKDNGTARALTWNAIYVSGGPALPSTTVLSKKWKGVFDYDTTNSLNKWTLIGSSQEQ